MRRSLSLIPLPLRDAILDCSEGRSPWPLLVSGSVGVGKTAAALVTCDYVPGSRYWEFDDFCDLLRDAELGRAHIDMGTETRQMFPVNLWNEVRRTPLLVLDDVGCQDRASDFVYKALKKALDARSYTPLILATNLDANGLRAVFDNRIVSRMFAGTAIRLEGADRRNARRDP